jgi:molybdate transport system ATP-binding protein
VSAEQSPTLSVRARVGYRGFDLDFSYDFLLTGVTALFGPSGAGKSTVLRILAGLESGASGRIRYDGQTWLDTGSGRSVPAHLRGVGYVFQDARLFSHLDVLGNLRFAHRRAGRDGKGAGFDDVVEALDLESLLARSTDSLSGGERQRVAIGRALLTRPRLLLLDEPLAAMDAARKGEILPYIEALPEEFGIPAIYVSHSIDEVARLADRMVVMADGKIAACGDAVEVLERPDLQHITGHFEAGAVIDARVVEHDPEFRLTRVEFCGQDILMPMAELPIGEVIRLRIRARDVSLARQRPESLSTRNVIRGVLTDIVKEPETAFAEAFVDAGGGLLRARLTRKAVADLDLVQGDQVFALVKSVSFDRRALTRSRREAAAGKRTGRPPA